MVAAQSRNALKANKVLSLVLRTKFVSVDQNERQDKRQFLPSADTCLLHLRLLTAFSMLRQNVCTKDELFGVEGLGASKAWTIFVAKAVVRFGRWIRLAVQQNSTGGTPYVSCSKEALAAIFYTRLNPLQWSEVVAPPIDVLMVLHSYMLNPRDFLSDSVRNDMIQLWKAGFPWNFVKAHVTQADFLYSVPEPAMKAYEQATGDSWASSPDPDTTLGCTRCKKEISILWSDLYAGDLSQMGKGNTETPFTLVCSSCQTPITQSSLCLQRFQEDITLLLDCNVPMPGTLLDLSGRVCQSHDERQIPLHLNEFLRSGPGHELLEQRQVGTAIKALSELADIINLQLESVATKSPTGDNPKPQPLDPDTLCMLKRGLRHVIASYDKNASPFALDLVGAVMRQGAFIDKMREFDWIHSPAQNSHASFAIDRYIGFLEVMKQNPEKVAVPTFDVDLVWHTHQLNPQSYYDFTIKHCNGVFIDHDDKFVDNVLSNSFEWTCDEYAKITGSVYDKCLCWCCALLEADHLAQLDKSNDKIGKFKSRIKRTLARLSNEEMSEAEMSIMQIQTMKFEQDYAKSHEGPKTTDSERRRKIDFFNNYVWHYPMYAPSPETIQF